MTGGALTDTAVRNATTGLFRYGSALADGLNTCVNGDCSLPGETEVVDGGCYGAVSVFTIDYDAPQGLGDYRVRSKLEQVAAYGDPAGTKRRRSLSKRTIENTHPLRHE
jgi:5'-nucleotidase